MITENTLSSKIYSTFAIFDIKKQNNDNIMTSRQTQWKQCFPFHCSQSQGHLEAAAEDQSRHEMTEIM